MMLVEILQIQFGYLVNVLYLFSGISPRATATEKTGIYFLFAIWIIVAVWQRNFYVLVLPLLFFLLISFFQGNFRNFIASVESSYKLKINKILDEISNAQKILATEQLMENEARCRLENVVHNCMAAKETLAHLNKVEFCQKILEIILTLEGVISVAIYDGEKLSAMPAGKLDWYNDIYFHNPSKITEANILTFNLGVCPNNDVSIFLECKMEQQKNIKNILDSMIPIISLGFRRVNLFEEYELKSRRDALTGLFNRRYFEIKLGNEVGRARRYKNRFGILMLDIDYFKEINDTCGHSIGDVVLQKIAQIISSIDYPGAFAGRYGGEEFVICLPVCDRDKMGIVAESLRQKIQQTSFSEISNNMLKSLTVSIGGAIFPDNGDSASEIISVADLCLYKAKESGRNRVVVL